MKNKIAFIVATQYDNVGDLLINKCLINELCKHADVYLDVKNVPNAFKELLFSKTENVYDLSVISSHSFKGIGVFPLLFNNPGITHLFKSPGPFGSGGNKKIFLKNMFIGLIFKLFKLRGVKSFLVGNDIHCTKRLDKFALKFFSENTAKLLCRSTNNVEELKRNGIQNVAYIPDMCFGFSPEILTLEKENHIGVSFRRLDDLVYHNSVIETIQKILDTYKQIKLTFFYQVEHDYNYNKELYDLFKDNGNVIFRTKCLDWNDLSFYSPFLCTLSNRLHVLLLGLVNGGIPLALLNTDSKTQKIIDIFEGIHLHKFLFQYGIKEDELYHILTFKNEFQTLIKEVNSSQKEKIVTEIASLF